MQAMDAKEGVQASCSTSERHPLVLPMMMLTSGNAAEAELWLSSIACRSLLSRARSAFEMY